MPVLAPSHGAREEVWLAAVMFGVFMSSSLGRGIAALQAAREEQFSARRLVHCTGKVTGCDCHLAVASIGGAHPWRIVRPIVRQAI